MSISLAEWRASGKTYLHHGYPVFYREAGAGEALMLVHGFPTASWDWSALWPELSQRFRCIAPDMMGFGFSAKPRPYNYSILDQADLHEGLLKELGVRRVHILAHDYGDTVAQELLARFHERQASGATGAEILSVCFLNGGLFPEVHRARFVQTLLNSPIGSLLGRLMNQRSFSRSFAAVFGPDTQPSAQELQAFWELVSHNNGTRISHLLIRYLDERREHRNRWVGALQETRIPLRFINGVEDPVSGRHMAERYRELVPEPQIRLLEGVGHYPQVEAPALVLADYTSFVEPLI